MTDPLNVMVVDYEQQHECCTPVALGCHQAPDDAVHCAKGIEHACS